MLLLQLSGSGVLSGTSSVSSGILSSSTSGSLTSGLTQMTSYVGNAILPILAGLSLAAAVLEYTQRRNGHRFVIGAILLYSVSGLVRLAEQLVQQQSGANQTYGALLALADYVGNTLMPVFAAYNFSRAALAFGGLLEQMNIGDDYLRYVFAALLSLLISGALRLIEYMITSAQGISS